MARERKARAEAARAKQQEKPIQDGESPIPYKRLFKRYDLEGSGMFDSIEKLDQYVVRVA